MRCARVQKLMSRYLDGELRTSEKYFVSRHINICPACRHELDELQSAMKLIRVLPEVSAPPAFWTHLAKQLVPAGRPKRRWPGIAGFFPGGRFWPGAAVAAALILVMGLTSLWYGLANQQRGAVSLEKAKGNGNSETIRMTRSIPDKYGEISSIEGGQERKKAPGTAPAVKKEQENEKAIIAGRQQEATGLTAGEENNAGQRRFADPQQDSAPASPTALTIQKNAGAKQPAKIIHRIMINMEVDDQDRFYNLLSSLVRKRGGEISADTVKETSRLEIIIPVSQMSLLLKEIESAGKVSRREVQDMDVTEDYLHTQEHLEQLQQEKEKLLSLVKNSPGSREEDPIQAELKNIQLEIEKTESSLKNIEEDLSTAKIYIFFTLAELN